MKVPEFTGLVSAFREPVQASPLELWYPSFAGGHGADAGEEKAPVLRYELVSAVDGRVAPAAQERAVLVAHHHHGRPTTR